MDEVTLGTTGPPDPPLLKDRYRIDREIGRGGFGVVYLARDRQLHDKRVVVKVLLDQAGTDGWALKKFHQEMEALALIDHPGVVGALDAGQMPDGRQFLVMQFVEGVTLRQVIASGKIPFDRTANIVRQIGQALSAAHEKGVCHRDLKPPNIMLHTPAEGEEHVKLIDFGIAAIQESGPQNEKTRVAGSYHYMAPEQYSGTVRPESDVFAFGVVAYEMLAGHVPFASPVELLQADRSAMEAKLKEACPQLPEAACTAILKAVAAKPEDRYRRPRDFGDALARALTAPASQIKAPWGSLEIAHVLFTDLVGYSLLSMDRQREYLDEFQRIVRETPQFRVAEGRGDLIRLPTGDGMALVFFGDPTAPVQCALEIQAGLKSRPHLQVRMGAHTGPVYRVADINANLNVSGGGINMAQRIMDLGDAGHILLSKNIADVLLQLTNWAPRLTDLGEHVVKHGAKLHFYNLSTADAGNAKLPQKVQAAAPRKSRTPLFAAVAAGVAVAAASVVYMQREPPPPPVPELAFNYSITVQKFRDGKPYEKPFRVRGDIIFEKDYQFALDLGGLQPGHLYILNEGPLAEDGLHSFNVLHPLPGASSAVAPNQQVRIPPKDWFVLDAQTGAEKFYLVWSAEAVPELDEAKDLKSSVQNGIVVIQDPRRMRALQDLLARYLVPKSQVERNDETRQTVVKARQGILAHLLLLEHH